jgi:murein DD-endopeptidase MepM/ murein hydrolase activator NlpD
MEVYMENYTVRQKMSIFMKRFGYYILLGVVVVGFILTLILVSTSSNKKQTGVENIVDTNTGVVTPVMPVLNATIYKGYYGDKLTYNETLKQWETHNGIDFQVASGAPVYSILDGVVASVYSNIFEGNVVVIEHENGLVSTYGSLDDSLLVEKGDKVKAGEEIGKVSKSASNEVDAGAHLHFAMLDNGEKIDPASYLEIEVK